MPSIALAARSLAPCAALLLPAGAAALAGQSTETGSPIADQGSNYDYRSELTGVTPKVRGLEVQVLEFADRLLLTNHTGMTVTIYGYEGEPYARVLADGTAEENEHSPATYLNTNFYGDVTVPSYASSTAKPDWVVVDRTGQFEWHDHRIHWASPVPPPRVKDRNRRTFIFNWRVPIQVGSGRGAIEGQLFWTPERSKASIGVIVLGAAIAVLGLLFVLYVRRRRSRDGAAGGSDVGPGGRSSGAETW
jgi:hypothetical protein